MAGSVNKYIVIGNVGADPKISGKSARFSIATSESYKNREGERVEETQWHNIVAFGNDAEYVDKFVKKGDKVYAEGKFKTSEWEGKLQVEMNGAKVTSLQSKSSNQGSSGNTQSPSQTHPLPDADEGDDLPF
jgi:single-strand DNA-binding protein